MPSGVTTHAERVERSVRYGSALPDAPLGNDDRLYQSWKRSLESYRLDPGRAAQPRILTGPRLKDHQEAMERFLRIARHGVRHLHEQVRDASYVVLLTNSDGVTIDFLGNPNLDRELKRAGLYLGSCWSEKEEGTCGVGTAIIDGSPITVHKGEHFRAPNITLTCSAAPVMDPHGNPLAILDASALNSPDDKKSQLLVLQFVHQSAILIENAYFLECYQDAWVLQLSASREFLQVQTDYLLAVNDRGQIVAANRKAKREVLADMQLPVSLESVFDLRVEHLAPAAQHGVLLPMHQQRTARTFFGYVREGRNSRAAAIPVTSAVQTGNTARINPLAAVAGQDPVMLGNASRVKQMLDAPIALLLLGETGTGKEAFAKAIHATSRRADKPFIAVNCAAIPETLIESELFGYADGAFTGARAKGMRGRIAQSHGGTLFLDEIGDMPLALQTRLLRVLAEGEVQPLGDSKAYSVALRIISATHQNLATLVSAGRFRADLYYRLAGATFKLPELRNRSDGAELVRNILREEAGALGKAVDIEPDVVQLLLNRPWPGNIRELRNALRYAVSVCSGRLLCAEDFPDDVGAAQHGARDVGGFQEFARHISAAFDPSGSQAGERARIVAALRHHCWQVNAAAKELGMSRATLYRRMERLAIVSPNREDGAAAEA